MSLAALCSHWCCVQPFGAGTVISTAYNGGQVGAAPDLDHQLPVRVNNSQQGTMQNDHALHYTKFGPDGYLYANQGAPSNTGPCSESRLWLPRASCNSLPA